jgi:hypothetical protein
MALAVVHAIRTLGPGYSVRASALSPPVHRLMCGVGWFAPRRRLQDLGLAIKWPNDIYSVEAGTPRTLRKLGGVLVHSNYVDGRFVLVVGMGVSPRAPPPPRRCLHASVLMCCVGVWAGPGCGVNVSNSEPTDCVNDVITRHNARTGASLPLLRKEVRATCTHRATHTLTMSYGGRNCWRVSWRPCKTCTAHWSGRARSRHWRRCTIATGCTGAGVVLDRADHTTC